MKNSTFILLALLFTFSCQPRDKESETLFSLLSPSATKVGFINQLTENEQFNIIEYLYFNNGAGVAAGDINNDGLIDLYFTSNQQSNKLYLNKGNLRFEDITDASKAAGQGDWKTGVTMADVNGDDFNADGKEDILTAANFCGISPYHGRFVSNTGTILSGDGRTLSGLETGINFSQKEIRRITRIRVDNEFYLLAAPNNDYLLWYKIKEL